MNRSELKGPTRARPEKYVRRKNRVKIIRSVLEAILLVGLLAFLAYVVFFRKTYTPYSITDVGTEDHGFIAVSYFGVEKYGHTADTLINSERLRAHIAGLKNSGYVTITQQDVLDYYDYEKALPEKALFLMFEDGRRDTAVFSQPFLEDANYCATVLSYADKFEKRDNKFLRPDDLLYLQNTGFWELGTNGYRLAYINVFNRYDDFYGELNSNEFVTLAKYMRRNYDHYLMDFIRDQDHVPVESYEQMQARIESDYESMDQIYTNEIGFLPRFYVLMHANSGQFGTNDLVSAENAKHIQTYFAANFNREGGSLNTRESSVYDLTRMQPQGHWSVNHLLMRIQDDTKQSVAFVTGKQSEADKWETLQGVAEYVDGTTTVTSLPSGKGQIRLKDLSASDLDVSVVLEGNLLGNQTVWLRCDNALTQGVAVSIECNELYVRQNGAELAHVRLFDLLEQADHSVDEDMLSALIDRQDVVIKYGESQLDKQYAAGKKQLLQEQIDDTATLEDGAEAYEPDIDLLERARFSLQLSIRNDALSVLVDDKVAARDLPIAPGAGGFALESAPANNERYNQRNLIDDVYDGVFTDLKVTTPEGAAKEGGKVILYDESLTLLQTARLWVRRVWEMLINWFITNL